MSVQSRHSTRIVSITRSAWALAFGARTGVETDEGADDEVDEGQHRGIVPGLSERESGYPTPTGG